MIEINGTAGNDNLPGTGEADVIFGLEGNDLISGSSGDDSLFGFEGNDTLYGNEGNDTLFGNQNSDLLIGWGGEDWLFGGKEGDIIEDGTGEDEVFGNLGDDLLRGGADNDQKYGGQANDTVIGGTGNDQVFGDRGNDILWGVDVDAINPGINEIDTLTGGSEQDIFVLGDQSRLYYIGSGNNDFALITDFNVIEDKINIGNNQVIYAETVLNELGLGVAISSQNGDLIAFVQNANVSQFIESSNVVEPPQTEEAIPRQIEEPQFPEVIVPTPTPTPVVITPTPTPTPDPITPTPTPTPVVITPTPTPTPDPIITPTPTPDPIITPTPTPTPVVITPTPTPVVITPTPTPTPTPVVITPTPTPTPEPVFTPTPTPTPVVITPTPTPEPEPQPNIPPVADNDNYSTDFQSPITVDAVSGVLNGDSDGNGDDVTAILVNPPANGSLNYFNADGSFSYTPNMGFSGVDSFIYVANDGKDNSNVATVTIAVGEAPPSPPTPTPTPNTPPVADNDDYSTGFQSPITVNASAGVLNGDSDTDGDAVNAILVNPPNNGSLNLNPDGSFSYIPNMGFSGVDSFIYVANDGKDDSNVATVTIDVGEPPNTPPVADNDDYSTGFQSPLTVDASVGVLNGDTDSDGNSLTAILVNSPANGSVNLNENGSFSYTPNSGFSGVDSFTYTANDRKSDSNIATVTIDVEYIINLNGYSQRDSDDTQINSTFLLTNEGSDGEIIVDQTLDENGNDSDTSLGFFPEAIQDFITYDGMRLPGTGSAGYQIDFEGETELFEEGSNITLSFDEEGQPIFTGLDISGRDIKTEFTPVVDLRVRLIEPDALIAELELIDEEKNPIVELDDSFQEEIIVYELINNEDNTILEKLFLFTNKFQTLEEVIFTDDSLDQSDKVNLAINSLDSIIDEDLLSLTENKNRVTFSLLYNNDAITVLNEKLVNQIENEINLQDNTGDVINLEFEG
ncbi:Ig-like domain-containing protein [Limnoraphis robusta]|uniref:Ig-like domain-containing protein n=1 Tax=Limnoraphis robusta CCNP1315 TaxID=3110306 RepID=A0ABU5U3D5_9CYAN|nr:Ig-like domain-containing protein [Limnoraphis robusta]MEA5521669.1 Ig-like domain-containing protein [Limnoraphis robusta CCNP1315]MEA5547051.1 Ig-like domain-containing protein [Limnoraphis robusta CCNP1324]